MNQSAEDIYLSEPLWALALWEVVSAWPGQCGTAMMVSAKAALPKSSSVCCCLSLCWCCWVS